MILSIFLVLATIVVYLLFTPLVLEVDSERDLYQLRLQTIASAAVYGSNGRLLLRVWVLGWTKTIDLLQKRPTDEKSQKRKTRKKRDRKAVLRKIRAVLRTFKVSYFFVNIDTDDYAINALLYPLGHLLSKPPYIWRINFEGRIQLRIKITNNLARIMIAAIK